MTTSDLVKQMCQEEGMSIVALARELGQSRQNFYKKLQRDTLTLTELKEIANVLGADFSR
ncbi:XRE family transcriptional regulator [Firmicutes bacterium OM04-13BH]|nr:XRE family transcriptional regulator [Firmicutes bacterium OM04-13BH]